mgnify:CR=1 FL=1
MASKKKMCTSKKRYTSEKAANFFASADGLRPYPCPHCKGWHLTSAPKKKKEEVIEDPETFFFGNKTLSDKIKVSVGIDPTEQNRKELQNG